MLTVGVVGVAADEVLGVGVVEVVGTSSEGRGAVCEGGVGGALVQGDVKGERLKR